MKGNKNMEEGIKGRNFDWGNLEKATEWLGVILGGYLTKVGMPRWKLFL